MNAAGTRPHWVRSMAWVLACLAAALALAVMAREIAKLGRSETTSALVLGEVQMLVHPAGATGLTPAQAVASTQWKSVALPIAAGWTNDSVWVRTVVRNDSPLARNYWLEVSPSRLPNVRVHSQGSAGWTTQASGNGVHARSRPVDQAALLFPLSLSAGERRTLLVEVSGRGMPLLFDLALHDPVAYPGLVERANMMDLLLIGGELLLGLVCLALGLPLWHLGLTLLAARAFVGVVFQLQQYGAGALFLSAPMAAAVTHYSWLLLWLTQVLIVSFIWSFMAHAGLARWMHRVYAVFFAVSVLLVAAPSVQHISLLILPFVAFTVSLNIYLIFRGYLPAVALLTGGIAALAINAPTLLGSPIGGVPRYAIMPLPLLLTLMLLLLAVGLALRRERLNAAQALEAAQSSTQRELEVQVAERTRELQAAHDKAARANRSKSDFLAKVSHELRTPMHAVLGYLDLALREPLLPAVARRLKAARQAGHQLVMQINDLLEHARSERSLLRLSPGSVSLPDLVQVLRDRAGLLFEEGSNQFELHCDPRLPATIWVDGQRLEQVLMALLNNAMHYTRRGRVSLRMHLIEPEMPESPMGAVRFEVQDSGPGISRKTMALLGNAFERGGTVDGQGLGLGLSIARELLGLMGARLEITSQVGVGSCFAFALHLTDRALAPDPLASPATVASAGLDGRSRCVLVLEENPANRNYLVDLLTHEGFLVHGFAGVDEALDFVRGCVDRAESGPSLCIVDQHLAEPDGHEGDGTHSGWAFVQTLRGLKDARDGRPGCAACPVLMVSATEARPPENWRAEPGIQRHLLKPVEPALLLAALAELLAPAMSDVGGAHSMQLDDGPDQALTDAAAAGVPDQESASTPEAAWRTLAEHALSGSLSGLDEWTASHPGVLDADTTLQALVHALDFAGIARHAQERQGT